MVRLQPEQFDPALLMAAFSKDRSETGAIVTFTGLARGESGAVTSLELEAYPDFTYAEITRNVEATRLRFGLQDVLVVHRIGSVTIGEAIVFVAAAAAHRRAAFLAADQLMDYLKSRAPFWKKENGSSGSRWIEPRPEDFADAARWD
jgi:molybdopterin synthase catalytic subunit